MYSLEEYLNRIMEIADLAPRDAKRVRSELQAHLGEWRDAGITQNLSEREVMTMVREEFGSPEDLGAMIAKARGRFRTYLKKQARRLPLILVAAVVLALAIKATALEAFRVTNDAASPRVPSCSRVLVNKLSRHLDVDDVVVFRVEHGYRVGIVVRTQADGRNIIVHRNGEPDTVLPGSQIVGKAIFLYSYAP